MTDGPALRPLDIGTVEDRFFTIRDFTLADGTVMPEATLAYETYGRLAPHGRNAVLLTHGFTSSHHQAGRNPANANNTGAWDGLVGPGKAIDTDKLFVVASNMLGSSFGSTNSACRNPNTGRTLSDETVLKKSQQTIYHTRIYPSHLVLPIVPELTSTTTSRYGAKRSGTNPAKVLTFQAR